MKWKTCVSVVLAAAFAVCLLPGSAWGGEGDKPLWELYEKSVRPRKFVDLTHAFAPGIPRWSGFPSSERKVLYAHEKDGFFAEQFTHVGQYGTHCDPPSHFHKGLRAIDEIPVTEMIMPLVVIDCSGKVKENADYQLSVEDLEAWEAKHGPIPAGSFVAMRSDWHKRFADVDSFYNKDKEGQSHYPGWSLAALKLLFEERKVNAIGHEPPDTDSAASQKEHGFECETYVLSTNHFQIELVANLDQVPEAGALLIATWPKPKAGSGFPARLFAILP